MVDKPETSQFPGQVVKASGADLNQPITSLLESIGILGNTGDLQKADGVASVLNGPPPSVAIIEAGATALTKWWTAGFGATLSLGTIFTALTGFWKGESDPVRVALVASAAFVLFAMAIMISSDVRARGIGAVAEVRARGEVAATFLQLAQQTPSVSQASTGNETLALRAAIARGGAVEVTLKDGKTGQVTGLRYNKRDHEQVHVLDDWVGLEEISLFTSTWRSA